MYCVTVSMLTAGVCIVAGCIVYDSTYSHRVLTLSTGQESVVHACIC